MSFRMIQPWVNPRSEFYWFVRRVPKAYRTFGMPSEIKFSLGTKDWDEAVLRCQEENLKLERQWRGNIVGTPPTELSHLQITALAGEFYAETVGCPSRQPGHSGRVGAVVEEARRTQTRPDRSARTAPFHDVRLRSARVPAAEGRPSCRREARNPSCARSSRRSSTRRKRC